MTSLTMLSSRKNSLFDSDMSDKDDNHQVDESMNTSDIPDYSTEWKSPDNFVSWLTFYNDINKPGMYLIIDVRKENDYYDNHVKNERIIFIQENVIKLGSEAYVYDAYLRDKNLTNTVYNKNTRQYNDITHRRLFSERIFSRKIYILDWSTTKDNITKNRKAELMRIILTKWDLNRCTNVSIVEGGYCALIINCPKILTNPHYKLLPKHAYDYRDEPIDNIEYPNWYFKFNQNEIPPVDFITNKQQITQQIIKIKLAVKVYNNSIQLHKKIIEIIKVEIKWEKYFINVAKNYIDNCSSSQKNNNCKLLKNKLINTLDKINHISDNKKYIKNKINNINYNDILILTKNENIIQKLKSEIILLEEHLDIFKKEHCILGKKINQIQLEFNDYNDDESDEENNIETNQSQLNNQQHQTYRFEKSLQYPLTNTNFNDIRNNLNDKLTDSQTLPDIDKIKLSSNKKNTIKKSKKTIQSEENNLKNSTDRIKIKPKRKINLKKMSPRKDLTSSSYENNEFIQQEPGLRGLANIGGKTCYMNCAIQCLDKIDEFKKYLLAMIIDDDKETLVVEFIKMLKELNEINQPAFSPDSFKDAFKIHVGIQNNFNVDHQQDSQEFLTLLFDELHNDLKIENNILSEEHSIVKDTFKISVRQKISCQSCHNQHLSKKTEYILLAPLPSNDNDDITLGNCLKKYFEEQPLDNTNCEIENCGSQSRTIILEPLELPPVMIIQLMRFCNDGTKNNSHVNFPTKGLKMNKYFDNDADEYNGSMVDQQAEFDLVAVIIHEDTSGQRLLKYGHYFSYIYHSNTNSWYEFNDSIVKKIDETIVTKKDDRKTAYMLFYKKK